MILIFNAWNDILYIERVFILYISLYFINTILYLRQVINLIICKQFIRTKLESLTDSLTH